MVCDDRLEPTNMSTNLPIASGWTEKPLFSTKSRSSSCSMSMIKHYSKQTLQQANRVPSVEANRRLHSEPDEPYLARITGNQEVEAVTGRSGNSLSSLPTDEKSDS